MSPERWKKVNEVFQEAVELEPSEQKAYLEEACVDDDSLLQQVETLLAANDQAGTFIAGNAAKDVAHLLTLKNSPTLTGESLGHYEIISILGSGGMGKVYLAKDSKLNRSIAVKTLPNSFSKESDHVKRFQTEAKAAANLNHPNVATVYSVEETDDNQTFITMEYIEGKPLSEMIPANGLDQRTFLEWFIAIADALAHAHEKGIVHRDIKPNNIMITPSGTPKILDFGLARIDKAKINEEGSTLSLTKTGQVLGTPAYMSPEQAEGKEADQRTDIFSLGIVMYEAITGTKPFKGDNYAAIVSNLLGKEPRHISELKPEVPNLLARIIMKCLSKEPRYRYQSMNEVRVLLTEISSAIDSGASLSRPPSENVSRPKSLSSWFTFGAIGLAVLFGAFAVWSWFYAGNKSENSVARFSLNIPQSSEITILESRISPDGKDMLMATFRDEGNPIYRRSLDSFEVEPIEGSEGGRKPFFSPDGQWIAYSNKANQIKKIPLKGGNSIVLCENCPLTFTSFWGADNFLYLSNNKGLYRISSDGGTPEQLTEVKKEKDENTHILPQLLPDKKSVLFTVQTAAQNKLAIFSLADKTWKYIEETGNAWRGIYLESGHIVFARRNQLMGIAFDLSTLQTIGKPKLLLSDVFEMSPNTHISKNGTLIYLPAISRTDNQIVWVDKKGDFKPALNKKGDYNAPRISPDGSKIVVGLDNDIWVYNLESGGGIRITDSDRNELPLWTKDGNSVIYATEKDNAYKIYTKSANGTGEAELLHESKFRLKPYSVHPTENVLAIVASNRQGDVDLITKSLDDSSVGEISVTKFREDTPRFSPDGKWVSYFSMDSGQPQVYVQPWDEKDGSKIAVTTNGGMFPLWSPKGNELFYRIGSKFFSVPVSNSDNIKFGTINKLFEGGKFLTSFDVSPDGERFLMVKDEHGTLPRQLNVVINWTEELKQNMKDAK